MLKGTKLIIKTVNTLTNVWLPSLKKSYKLHYPLKEWVLPEWPAGVRCGREGQGLWEGREGSRKGLAPPWTLRRPSGGTRSLVHWSLSDSVRLKYFCSSCFTCTTVFEISVRLNYFRLSFLNFNSIWCTTCLHLYFTWWHQGTQHLAHNYYFIIFLYMCPFIKKKKTFIIF